LHPVNQGNRFNDVYQILSTYVRKYNPSYLFFGFTYTGEEIEPVPQCVTCYETLSNHSMKPSLLTRHFETKHRDLNHKPLEYFQRKLSESKGQIIPFSGVVGHWKR
jgi:hypothetical protein